MGATLGMGTAQGGARGRHSGDKDKSRSRVVISNRDYK